MDAMKYEISTRKKNRIKHQPVNLILETALVNEPRKIPLNKLKNLTRFWLTNTHGNRGIKLYMFRVCVSKLPTRHVIKWF